MIGSFLTRPLIMVFGYAYPAYGILVAALTILERVGDALVSWLPLYSEAKLAFFVYLWFLKTKGTTYVYNAFFKPYRTINTKPQSKEKKETTTPQLDDLTLTVTEENKATHDEMKKG
ncbi:BnaCnng67550D [Brassica napus]|uniref:HVA22-like protein n=1 Tax=Brassica napus TaxID=3708 RepID=A0A078JV25_BRANA|nr:BnaCnng67550D [Brassica napus]